MHCQEVFRVADCAYLLNSAMWYYYSEMEKIFLARKGVCLDCSDYEFDPCF
jgi:hypothetical protein